MVRFSATIAAGIALASMLATVSAAVLSSRATEGELAFTKCNPSAQYPISARSIRVSPSPPAFGGPIKITAVGDLASAIAQGARAVVNAKIGPFSLKREIDVCAESAESGLPCPIAPGPDKAISVTDTLPSLPIHNQNVGLTVNIYNADNTVLLCVNANIFVV
ncbi:hypothetical protein THASP1DRAFT_22659 [Thamnocephalis sphaerospora]|uniref:Phosphatidylglycerol/phosphatidylinositol transfer protein n=1 Tax=Thamnocephalis sphaerospora TaxID=78915 RepID=A0A4P9XTL3_9FUNG|nr:hypothetical protein THASP1DRAFT_22659 [Thamnocephalis sphaerospora]|eukprot:RKP09515.1 hypothetical protein THASP1DRAFT_22659 [Thamnocephalis sphaerospora]